MELLKGNGTKDMGKRTSDQDSDTLTPEQRVFSNMMMGRLQAGMPGFEFRSEGFGFAVFENGKAEGRIELANLFSTIRARPEEADELIAGWLEELRKAMTDTLDGRSFASVSNHLFLAVRPLAMYEETTTEEGEKAIAFCWPVTPELGIYWAIDCGGSIAYVTRKQFDAWSVTEEEVTKVAYKNTIRDEADMVVVSQPKVGLIISSRSRFETVAHLLYWPANLGRLIRHHAPELHDDTLLLNRSSIRYRRLSLWSC